MSDRLRLALVGCGAISGWHRRAIAAVPGIEIAACVDVDRARAEAAAAATGAPAYGSLAEALAAGGFDAVDLMLPHHLHEPVALEAFAAGMHVLLEKPMATDLAACERILSAAHKAGTVFMVGENAQYWPEVRIARDLLAAGAIGDVVTARAQLFFPPLSAYYGGAHAWRLDASAAGGGIAIDTGSHYIRPLRLWLGEVEEVVAALGHPLPEMEGESLARALFRFRSGVVAGFDLLLTRGPVAAQEMFRITGREGEIGIGQGVTLTDAEHPRGVRVRPDEPQGYMESYAGQFADFARAVLRGEPLEAGAEVSLGELRTALAMARSAQTRRWERVWD